MQFSPSSCYSLSLSLSSVQITQNPPIQYPGQHKILCGEFCMSNVSIYFCAGALIWTGDLVLRQTVDPGLRRWFSHASVGYENSHLQLTAQHSRNHFLAWSDMARSLITQCPSYAAILCLYFVNRRKVYENRALRRLIWPKIEEVKGWWIRLHNEKLPNLFCYLIWGS